MYNKKLYSKEYSKFEKNVMSTKHSFWYEVLSPSNKIKLFEFYKYKKRKIEESKKTFSFRKFLFNSRLLRGYKVRTDLLRDSAINKILN